MAAKKCVVLLSGGLDSLLCLVLAIERFGVDNVHALTVFYGQKNLREVYCSQMLVDRLIHKPREERASEISADIEGREDRGQNVPPKMYEDVAKLHESRWKLIDVSAAMQGISSGLLGGDDRNFFVPGRNLLLISLASSSTHALGASAVYLGSCKSDTSADAKIAFVAVANEAVQTSYHSGGPIVSAPLIGSDKAEIVRMLNTRGMLHQAKYTHTDYANTWPPGDSPSAKVRAEAFAVLNLKDPALESDCLTEYTPADIRVLRKILDYVTAHPLLTLLDAPKNA